MTHKRLEPTIYLTRGENSKPLHCRCCSLLWTIVLSHISHLLHWPLNHCAITYLPLTPLTDAVLLNMKLNFFFFFKFYLCLHLCFLDGNNQSLQVFYYFYYWLLLSTDSMCNFYIFQGSQGSLLNLLHQNL